MSRKIRLPRGLWTLDEDQKLGEGGFGVVYRGHDSAGTLAVAVKKLRVDPETTLIRELDVAADLVGRQDLSHVLPILDFGMDAESDEYFIVMPLAERSLQAHLENVGPLAERDSVKILEEIALGLQEVPHLTHRDLKPGNVLWHEGRWKISDWGIARFVEESTSLNTLRERLTPDYAAPEQWKLEAAGNPTDVYALGCIAFALITGRPPFYGTREELRRNHIETVAPRCGECSPQLQTLLHAMLRKIKEGRPTLPRVVSVLQKIAASPSVSVPNSAIHALATAGQAEAEKRSIREAADAAAKKEMQRRRELLQVANESLAEVVHHLFTTIESATPEVQVNRELPGAWARLGDATLEVELRLAPFDAEDFRVSKWDVVATTYITVHAVNGQSKRAYGALLLYAKVPGDTDYRWMEVSFEHNPIMGVYDAGWPRGKPLLNHKQADVALGPGMSEFQKVEHPRPIDLEDMDAFCERWCKHFADAYNKRL